MHMVRFLFCYNIIHCYIHTRNNYGYFSVLRHCPLLSTKTKTKWWSTTGQVMTFLAPEFSIICFKIFYPINIINEVGRLDSVYVVVNNMNCSRGGHIRVVKAHFSRRKNY